MRVTPVLFRYVAPPTPTWVHRPGPQQLFQRLQRRQESLHRKNGLWGGNYTKRQPLWPTTLDMEVETTTALVPFQERVAPHLLPKEVSAPNSDVDNNNSQLLLGDLSSNAPSHEVWEELGFDPVMSEKLGEWLGPNPTKLQARVLPQLLNDPSDFVISGVTGSGKTAAMVAALVHAVRTEDEGLNVMVCADSFLCQQFFNAVREFVGHRGGKLVSRPRDVDTLNWLYCAPYRDDARKYFEEVQMTARRTIGPVRLLVTTPDVWNEMEGKASGGQFNTLKLGRLRRIYVDDVGPQLDMPPPYASHQELKERDANPTAIELMLAHIHQMLNAPSRSLLQIVCMSADLETRAIKHLQELCLNVYRTKQIVSIARLPPTIRMKFCYSHQRDRYGVTVGLALQLPIPGRAIIFVDDETDVLQARMSLRRYGMDVKLLSDIDDGNTNWRFLLLKESQGHGIDFDHVSHVFILCIPKNRYSFLHMAGRCGRLGQPGFCIPVWPMKTIRDTNTMLRELDVDITRDCIREDCKPVAETEIEFLTKPIERWDLEPQRLVLERYEAGDDPVVNLNAKLRWRGRSVMYTKEDYTPLRHKKAQYKKAVGLAESFRENPEATLQGLKEGGLISQENNLPTKKMRTWLKHPK